MRGVRCYGASIIIGLRRMMDGGNNDDDDDDDDGGDCLLAGGVVFCFLFFPCLSLWTMIGGSFASDELRLGGVRPHGLRVYY